MLISESWLQQNRELHLSDVPFGCGIRPAMFTDVDAFRMEVGGEDILDYGCGKAVMSTYIPNVTNYDPAMAEYSQMPQRADVVACTDVLEHIEPECLEAVLRHLWGLARRGVYLLISTEYDMSKTMPDGSNPHKIVKPKKWWAKKLRGWRPVEGMAVPKGVVFTCKK